MSEILAMPNDKLALEKAVGKCLEAVRPVKTSWIKLEQAAGRICADQYTAADNIPAFDRSRVDGYAIHYQDLAVLKNNTTLCLSCTGHSKAGDYPQGILQPGETWRVMTGAALPQGCAAVIKHEHIESDLDRVVISKTIPEGENIEKVAQVMAAHAILALPGQELDANDVEILASGGYPRVKVYNQPRVYLIQTGDELLMPGVPLDPGKIYNSNRSQFFALVRSRGAIPLAGTGPAQDKKELLEDEIAAGTQKAGLVIITGGTQQGDYDVVPETLNDMKARQLFAGLDVKPGQRTSAWTLNKSLVVNLPGNPAGGYLLFHALIRPVLNKLCGKTETADNWLALLLTEGFDQPVTARTLARGMLIPSSEGNYRMLPINRWSGEAGWEMLLDIRPGYTRAGQTVYGRPIRWLPARL